MWDEWRCSGYALERHPEKAALATEALVEAATIAAEWSKARARSERDMPLEHQ